MRRMKKRGPNVLYDLNDLLFFLTERSVGARFPFSFPFSSLHCPASFPCLSLP